MKFTNDTISDITSKQHYLCNVITEKPENIVQCYERKISYPISCAGDPSSWSSWSKCITSREGYKHRSFKFLSSQSECLVPSNTSSFEISTCIPEKENGKEVEKCFALTEIILVALGCLLMGILLTTMVFVFYMKRTQRGCFSKHIKNVQGDLKQHSGPDMQFLTESGVVKKYDSHNPSSANSKTTKTAEETQYESLNSNQVGNDQRIYDHIYEPRYNR
ncbi:hypothetical protein ACJMK2_016525 [Sinanodonta woodiana]|uniref:Uncharacterized protein n=1 Tax=Sinanodonta woodiana TaxID=1069815 RepID=A0ABD3UU14_SINWO